MQGAVKAKQRVRERTWRMLEHERAVPIPPGARDRIPNFLSALRAADNLTKLPEWRRARAVKTNPDRAQGPVRISALHAGKKLYMAVPRLAAPQPFVLLDPMDLSGWPDDAGTSEGAMAMGRAIAIESMPVLDLVVCGSVAVNEAGARVGKGGGFSDLEVAFLIEAGLLPERTPIVTTVDDLQVLAEELPETEHDFRVDVIVTPTRVIRTPRHRRPGGVLWEHLDDVKIHAIPVLARRWRHR